MDDSADLVRDTHPRLNGATVGLLIAYISGAVSLIVLIALAIWASSSGQASTPAALSTVEPTTTMQPVQPQAESVTPQAATAGVDPAWINSVSVATGISKVAVAAYGSVSLRLATEQPACKLGWTTLAGIGSVESGHGTEHGAHLLDNGTTSLQIIGPALDGTSGFALIRSTSETVNWHGDVNWDHAVGPMQFIPSTWEKWQSDGNADGLADPHNMFDAAYAAGRYLCASGMDLTTAAGWTQAIFSYNHSDDYVRSVLAQANAYAAAR